MGDIKVGPFEITEEMAQEMLRQPNPHGKPNSDVVKRWMIGRDINQRSRNMWIIDFGIDLPEDDAALYEAPFEYVLANVKPDRAQNRMTPLGPNCGGYTPKLPLPVCGDASG